MGHPNRKHTCSASDVTITTLKWKCVHLICARRVKSTDEILIIHILSNKIFKHYCFGNYWFNFFGEINVNYWLFWKVYLLMSSLFFSKSCQSLVKDVREIHDDKLNLFSCRWQINYVFLMICFYIYPVLNILGMELSKSNANFYNYLASLYMDVWSPY